MATLHESRHAILDSSTAWGGMLLTAYVGCVKIAGPHLKPLPELLVRQCRRTHEAYATHTSVTDLQHHAASSPGGLLARYPEYQALFDSAWSLVPSDGHAYWHDVAVNPALTVCMQSPALEQFAERGVRHYWPPAEFLRNSNTPNARFDLRLRTGPTALWDGLVAVPGEQGEVDVVVAVVFNRGRPRPHDVADHTHASAGNREYSHRARQWLVHAGPR